MSVFTTRGRDSGLHHAKTSGGDEQMMTPAMLHAKRLETSDDRISICHGGSQQLRALRKSSSMIVKENASTLRVGGDPITLGANHGAVRGGYDGSAVESVEPGVEGDPEGDLVTAWSSLVKCSWVNVMRPAELPPELPLLEPSGEGEAVVVLVDFFLPIVIGDSRAVLINCEIGCNWVLRSYGICDYRQRTRALARTKVIDNAFDKGLCA